MAYIGVDPGAGGGLVALDPNGIVLSVARMPETERDVLDWLREWADPAGAAVIERVQPMPRSMCGVIGGFKLGCSYGKLLMALTAAGVPFAEVRPQKWQAAMGCMSRGDKNVTKRRAQQLFPGVKVTHATADALLLALWHDSTQNGELAA